MDRLHKIMMSVPPQGRCEGGGGGGVIVCSQCFLLFARGAAVDEENVSKGSSSLSLWVSWREREHGTNY